jgi:hypothetical protein
MCIQAEASFLPFRTNLRSCCCLANYILQAKASFVPFLHHRAQYLLFILYYKQYTQKLSFSYFCINLSSFCWLKNMYSSRSFISPFPHQFTQFLLLGKLYITRKSFISSLPAPICTVSVVSFVLQAIHAEALFLPFLHQFSQFLLLRKLYMYYKQKLHLFPSSPPCEVSVVYFVLQAVHAEA